MITEDEKRWLGLRKNLCARCEFNLYDNPCIQYGKRGTSGECPGFYSTLCAEYNFVDAADFEARVAANLAIDRANGKHLRPKGCSGPASPRTAALPPFLPSQAKRDLPRGGDSV